MPYNASIPNPNDLLSVSQGDIRNNFTTANASFGVDHTAFDININPGYHKVVHLLTPNPNANPAPIANIGQLYSREITQFGATDEALHFESGDGRIYQMTTFVPNNVDNNVTNGFGSRTRFTCLPNGYILITGFTTTSVNGSTIDLSITTLTTILSINLTALGVSSSGTNRALVAQVRSVNTAAGTMVINLQDVNNNAQTSARTVYFTVIGN